jgi:hypothetical protein
MRNEGRTEQGLARTVKSACLAVLALLLSLFAFSAGAHEPITTKVMFNKEVVRILQQDCLGCHHPSGIAPMSLATYEEARPWAKAIKEELLEKRMPPWPVVKGYGDFLNSPRLAQRDIDLIVNWVEGGAPKGEVGDLPAGPLFTEDWQLGEPDLILKPQADCIISSDTDEERSFVLSTGLKQDRWISAIDLRPANGSVVHCASFYLQDGDIKLLSTWVPGHKTVALPQGIAQLLPAGSHILLKIHYRGCGVVTKDRSALGIYFTKTIVTKRVDQITISGEGAAIPAGQCYQVKADFTFDEAAEAIAICPLVHPLLVSFEATAYRPDDTEEVLIWTRGSPFDWQPTYYYRKGVVLPKGTRVEVVAYFNNSGGDRPGQWSASNPLCRLFIARPCSDNLNGAALPAR